jgi:hypothetical protein
MLTLAAVGITYQLLILAPVFYMAILLLILIASGIKMVLKYRKYKLKVKRTGKRWLMEDLIFRCGGSGLYLYLSAQFLRLDLTETDSWMLYLLASSIIVMLLVYDYIVLFVIPAKAEEHLKATYPEYNLEFIK